MKLGTILKNLRDEKQLEPEEVLVKLEEAGFEISEKTLQEYEDGTEMPDADIFLALCGIYDCRNILETFADLDEED